jgi:mRNA interferase MazF
MPAFVPDAGDLVWLTFDPQAGHEQAGRRPALVLSPKPYNQKSGPALVCPVTSHVKDTRLKCRCLATAASRE